MSDKIKEAIKLMEAILKSRDKLQDLLMDIESLKFDCDSAIDDLENAIETLSQQV